MTIKDFHTSLQSKSDDPRIRAFRRIAQYGNVRQLVGKGDNLIFLCWPIWTVTETATAES